RRDGDASLLVNGDPGAANPKHWPPTDIDPEIDHTTSIIPTSNAQLPDPQWVTDGGGLGDADDILMFTSRNDHEPFVGNMPNNVANSNNSVRPNLATTNSFGAWGAAAVESPLAEIIWYAIENPSEGENTSKFFGEPGMRTIYRRTLLIAPWVNPYHFTGSLS